MSARAPRPRPLAFAEHPAPRRRALLAAAAVLALALGATALPATDAAFTARTAVPVSSFAAKAVFGPQYVRRIGTGSCASPYVHTIPAGTTVPAGDTVVLVVGTRGSTSGAVGATDSRGNAYAVDLDHAFFTSRAVVLSSRLTTALGPGDQLTVTVPATDATAFAVFQATAVVAGTRVDATGTGTGESTTPSASVTTVSRRDLGFGVVATDNQRAVTEGAGWTLGAHVETTCGGAPGNATLHVAWRDLRPAGTFTYAPTISLSERWAAGIVAYRG